MPVGSPDEDALREAKELINATPCNMHDMQQNAGSIIEAINIIINECCGGDTSCDDNGLRKCCSYIGVVIGKGGGGVPPFVGLSYYQVLVYTLSGQYVGPYKALDWTTCTIEINEIVAIDTDYFCNLRLTPDPCVHNCCSSTISSSSPSASVPSSSVPPSSSIPPSSSVPPPSSSIPPSSSVPPPSSEPISESSVDPGPCLPCSDFNFCYTIAGNTYDVGVIYPCEDIPIACVGFDCGTDNNCLYLNSWCNDLGDGTAEIVIFARLACVGDDFSFIYAFPYLPLLPTPSCIIDVCNGGTSCNLTLEFVEFPLTDPPVPVCSVPVSIFVC